jgi:hypothetical protein
LGKVLKSLEELEKKRKKQNEKHAGNDINQVNTKSVQSEENINKENNPSVKKNKINTEDLIGYTPITQIPSHFKAYKDIKEFYVRGYTIGELESIFNNPPLRFTIKILRNLIKGIDNLEDLAFVDFKFLLIAARSLTDSSSGWNVKVTCDKCGYDFTNKVKLSDVHFKEFSLNGVPLKPNKEKYPELSEISFDIFRVKHKIWIDDFIKENKLEFKIEELAYTNETKSYKATILNLAILASKSYEDIEFYYQLLFELPANVKYVKLLSKIEDVLTIDLKPFKFMCPNTKYEIKVNKLIPELSKLEKVEDKVFLINKEKLSIRELESILKEKDIKFKYLPCKNVVEQEVMLEIADMFPEDNKKELSDDDFTTG